MKCIVPKNKSRYESKLKKLIRSLDIMIMIFSLFKSNHQPLGLEHLQRNFSMGGGLRTDIYVDKNK